MGTTFAKTNRRLRNFTRERRRLKQEARKKAGAAAQHAAGMLAVSGARTGKSKRKARNALKQLVKKNAAVSDQAAAAPVGMVEG